MAFKHGKSTVVLIDEFDLSNRFTETTLGGDVDMAETTTYGATVKTYIPGTQDGSIGLSGLFSALPLGSPPNDVDDVLHARVAVQPVLYSVAYDGFAVGKPVAILNAGEASYEISSSVSDAVRVSTQGQGGGPYRALSLHQYTTLETTTANGTSIDNVSPTTTAFGGIGQLHVPVNTRNGTLIVKIQDSADNAAFADLITFTTVGATTTAKEQLSYTGTVRRYIRATWTIAGSTGSVQFAVSFYRKLF